MDNQNIFNSLFECKKYNFKLGSISQRKCKTDMLTYQSINPILNNCLKYALRHLDKYKKQAIRILEFGVTYNMKLEGKMNKGDYYFCNELGRIENSRDDNFYECAIVVGDIDCKDDDIKKLIGELPKF